MSVTPKSFPLPATYFPANSGYGCRIINPNILGIFDKYPQDQKIGLSTHLLRSTYSGAALRVRRDSDNAETDIGFDINGVLDQQAAFNFAQGANLFVSVWYNQTTELSVFDYAQTSAANQPRLLLYDVNFGGNPVVYFDSLDFMIDTTGFSEYLYMVDGSDHHIQLMTRSEQADPNAIMKLFSAGKFTLGEPGFSIDVEDRAPANDRIEYRMLNELNQWVYNQVNSGDGAYPQLTNNNVAFNLSQSLNPESELWINKVSAASANPANAYATTDILQAPTVTDSNFPFVGYITEVLSWAHSWVTGDREFITNDQINRYT